MTPKQLKIAQQFKEPIKAVEIIDLFEIEEYIEYPNERGSIDIDEVLMN